MNHKFSDPKIFMLWHDRLGHTGSTMMHRIIENSHGHPLKNQKILLSHENLCTACSQGKLVIKPSHSKVDFESPSFLQRIQGDICGPIHPPSGPFCYFMVLVDEYCRSVGIDVEHPIPHVHTHNGLAKSLIKRLQVIARTLLSQYNYQFLYGDILFISDPLFIIIVYHYNL